MSQTKKMLINKIWFLNSLVCVWRKESIYNNRSARSDNTCCGSTVRCPAPHCSIVLGGSVLNCAATLLSHLSKTFASINWCTVHFFSHASKVLQAYTVPCWSDSCWDKNLLLQFSHTAVHCAILTIVLVLCPIFAQHLVGAPAAFVTTLHFLVITLHHILCQPRECGSLCTAIRALHAPYIKLVNCILQPSIWYALIYASCDATVGATVVLLTACTIYSLQHTLAALQLATHVSLH